MFEFLHGSLHAESVPLEAIAGKFDTPCCVYFCAVLAATRAAEAMLDGTRTHLVRERLAALFALEHVLR